jgi:hypothetical protein
MSSIINKLAKNYFDKLYLFGYFFVLLGSLFVILASFYHPIIGDDIVFKYNQEKLDNNFLDYFNFYYLNHTGRISQILLSYLIFSDDLFLYFFKLISFPVFLIVSYFAWKQITNYEIINSKNLWIFLLFFICLWLSLPSVDETVIWSSGFITYLISIMYFFILTYIVDSFHKTKKKYLNYILNLIFLIFFGFLTGSSNEQISFITIVYLVFLYIKNLLNRKENNSLLIISIISVIIGFVFLFFAPGNYSRLSLVEEKSIISKFITFILYFFSGYFKLGDEDTGSNLWFSLFLIVFLLNPNFKFTLKSFKANSIWLLISLLSLMVMFPIVEHSSTRTTFFAIFFLYVFVLKFSYIPEKNYIMLSFYKNIIFTLITAVFFFDGFVGFITNKSLSNENFKREQLLKKADIENHNEIYIPVFSTKPSRLTYILPPHLEKNYLKYYFIDKDRVYYDEGSYQNEIDPLKIIKFIF